jgi:hypothetical protein
MNKNRFKFAPDLITIFIKKMHKRPDISLAVPGLFPGKVVTLANTRHDYQIITRITSFKSAATSDGSGSSTPYIYPCDSVYSLNVFGHGQNVFSPGQIIFGHGQNVFSHGQIVFGHGQNVSGHGQIVFSHGQNAFGHGQNTCDNNIVSLTTN